MGFQSFYDVLGVAKESSKKDIVAAYRKKAQQYHPDKKQGDAVLFMKVKEAYEVLRDDEKRRIYDSSFERDCIEEREFKEVIERTDLDIDHTVYVELSKLCFGGVIFVCFERLGSSGVEKIKVSLTLSEGFYSQKIRLLNYGHIHKNKVGNAYINVVIEPENGWSYSRKDGMVKRINLTKGSLKKSNEYFVKGVAGERIVLSISDEDKKSMLEDGETIRIKIDEYGLNFVNGIRCPAYIVVSAVHGLFNKGARRL